MFLFVNKGVDIRTIPVVQGFEINRSFDQFHSKLAIERFLEQNEFYFVDKDGFSCVQFNSELGK